MQKRKAKSESNYRWVIMALAFVTAMLVITMPTISLSVLFDEIATDLNLDLVQIGIIWGTASLMGMFVGFIGGGISDKIGTRRSLILICLFTGIFGGLRSITADFWGFVLLSFLLGLFQQAAPVNVVKIIRDWFPARQLGTAMGLVSVGFGLGLMLGSLLSASVLSPLLGGWRAVLIFYGVLSVAMCGLWYVLHPHDTLEEQTISQGISLGERFAYVVRLRNVWIIGLGGLGVRACVAGMTGYLPTYLRDIGWAGNDADSALAFFFLASIIFVIPISMLSDRMTSRRPILIAASACMALGVALLFVAEGALIWVAIFIAGFSFDGFMSIYNTALLEVRGVGAMYAGTALGFGHMLRNLGGTVSPPVGNSLAYNSLNMPFLFWGVAAVVGMVAFMLLQGKTRKSKIQEQVAI